MIERHSITILVPVYNEEGLLEDSLSVIQTFAEANIADYELLVVESGSTDRSALICDAHVRSNRNASLILEGRRNGFGSALKLGYARASKDWIWMITSDIPFPLEAITAAAKLFDGHDVILSYRSRDPRGRLRRLQSTLYSSLVHVALGIHVRHVNSAFRVIRRPIAAGLDIVSNGWFVDAEVLYWINKLQYRYVEIPVPLIKRRNGRSTVGAFTFLDVLKEMAHFLRVKDRVNTSKVHGLRRRSD
jgi:glycosyltransferase involved in cell wall biosynthesis